MIEWRSRSYCYFLLHPHISTSPQNNLLWCLQRDIHHTSSQVWSRTELCCCRGFYCARMPFDAGFYCFCSRHRRNFEQAAWKKKLSHVSTTLVTFQYNLTAWVLTAACRRSLKDREIYGKEERHFRMSVYQRRQKARVIVNSTLNYS